MINEQLKSCLVYEGVFRKTDGSWRKMQFVHLKDLPPGFLAGLLNYSEQKAKPVRKPGMELVYDIEADDFRTFNHKTAIGELKSVASR
jgi:hypothetical protein